MDIDAFTKQIDPLKQYECIKQLGSNGMFVSKALQKRNRMSQRQALIAAAKLSSEFPRNYDPMLSISTETISAIDKKVATGVKLSSGEDAALTRNRTVYFSNNLDDILIVIDSGASTSLTPNIEDFINKIQPASTK